MTRRVDRYGLVTTEIKGQITTADWLDAVLELGELTAYSNEIWEIAIFDASVRITDDHRTSMELVHAAKEAIQFKSRGALAMTAPSRRMRDWAEDVAGLLRGDTIPVVVFHDEADARKWIEIHRETARYHATTRIVKRPEHFRKPL